MNGCHFGNLAMELSTQDELMRQKLVERFDWVIDWIEAALIDAVAAEDLPRIDTRRAAQALLAYTEGILLLAKTQNDPDLIKRLTPDTNFITQLGVA